MKTYVGVPTDDRGGWVVAAISGSVAQTFACTVAGRTELAGALLCAVIGPDKSLKLYQRFKWRTVSTWQAGKPFTISEDEIMAVVAEIEQTAGDPSIKAEQHRVELEQARPEREDGLGYGGVPVQWDTDDAGQRIRPRGSDE